MFIMPSLLSALSCVQVMQVMQELMPEAVRPYSLLHSHTPDRSQMVNSLVFTDTDTLVSGSRDCHVSIKLKHSLKNTNQLPYIAQQ